MIVRIISLDPNDSHLKHGYAKYLEGKLVLCDGKRVTLIIEDDREALRKAGIDPDNGHYLLRNGWPGYKEEEIEL